MIRAFQVGFLLFCLTACAVQPTTAVPDWKLIYHHDKDGNAIAGDKNQLITLIREGRPVRIFWPIGKVLDHIADAGFITIMNNEVFAQTDAIIRQIPDKATRRRIALDAKNQSRWSAIFSTTGELRSFQSQEGKLTDYRFELKWYVFTSEAARIDGG